MTDPAPLPDPHRDERRAHQRQRALAKARRVRSANAAHARRERERDAAVGRRRIAEESAAYERLLVAREAGIGVDAAERAWRRTLRRLPAVKRR